MRMRTSVSYIMSHHNDKRQSTGCDDDKTTMTLFARWQWRDPQGKPSMHLYCVARRQQQQQWRWRRQMLMTRPRAWAHGISYRIARRRQWQQLWRWRQQMSTTRPCARAHGISHIMLLSRDNDNNYWRQRTTSVGGQGLVCELTTYSYRITRWQQQQCQAHIFSVKHRRNNQPGNVKLRRARAIL